MKCKIIKEYEHFYLCEYKTKLGLVRECFIKNKRLTIKDNYIIIDKNYSQDEED